MSPPATPTRALISSSLLITTHSPRPQTKRFLNANSTTLASQKSVDLSGEPFHSSTNDQDSTSDGQDTLAVSPKNYLTKATEEACNEARRMYFKRESITREYSKALDEASGRLWELGLGDLTKSVEAEIALILQQFAKGEKIPGNSQSEFYPTYAQAARANTSGYPTATLPKKPTIAPIKEKIRTQKPDNRIFTRLPEEYTSRSHHVYAVKAALTSRLNLEHGPLKTVRKVNSGFAIVPNNDKQVEELLSKENIITKTIGGTVEKGEEWHTYVIENVPRSLMSLDGKRWNVTEENAREEVLAVTGNMPTRVAWSRKTLDNSATTGTIVAYFKNPTPPFRLFCTSSLARKIFKSQKVSQCTKYLSFYDSRLCHSGQRCKNCGTTGLVTCQAKPRCYNCKGPHAADEKYCPARPTMRGGAIRHLTQPELRRIRQAGQRAWLLLNPSVTNTENPSAQPQC